MYQSKKKSRLGDVSAYFFLLPAIAAASSPALSAIEIRPEQRPAVGSQAGSGAEIPVS